MKRSRAHTPALQHLHPQFTLATDEGTETTAQRDRGKADIFPVWTKSGACACRNGTSRTGRRRILQTFTFKIGSDGQLAGKNFIDHARYTLANWPVSLLKLEALEYGEQSLAVAIAPLDKIGAAGSKGCALVLLRLTEEGAVLLEDHRRGCVADGNLYTLAGSDAIFGVCKALQGNIKDGIRIIEEAILKREREGYRDAADWYRGFLIEVYLQIIAGKGKAAALDFAEKPARASKGDDYRASAHSILGDTHSKQSSFRSRRSNSRSSANASWAALSDQKETGARHSPSDGGATDLFPIWTNSNTCTHRGGARGDGTINVPATQIAS